MGHLVDDVKLLNGDLVNFIEDINAWDVHPVVKGIKLVSTQHTPLSQFYF